jgi:hypothetical protein
MDSKGMTAAARHLAAVLDENTARINAMCDEMERQRTLLTTAARHLASAAGTPALRMRAKVQRVYSAPGTTDNTQPGWDFAGRWTGGR